MLLEHNSWSANFHSLSDELYENELYKTLPDASVLLFNDTHCLADSWQPSELLSLLDKISQPNQIKSLAMGYAGHQFGQGVSQLGDGRGMLLGEWKSINNDIIDIYLKGSGPTQFSRGFDGRATLKSSIREFIASIYCKAIGIPSTNALAVVASSEQVLRDRGNELTGLLVRTGITHIRFGSFEWLFRKNRDDLITKLADFCRQHYYPECNNLEEFLLAVTAKTARMIALWQVHGFCHGVMNTDNMSIAGETFDFGPFSFMDDYNPNFVCNLSDYEGRYRYNFQPSVGNWNIQVFLSCFARLSTSETLRDISQTYTQVFADSYKQVLCERLGLPSDSPDDILDQWQLVLDSMEQHHIDYNGFFLWLEDQDSRHLGEDKAEFVKLDAVQTLRGLSQGIKDNQQFILRNGWMQECITAFYVNHDRTSLDQLVALVQNPYHKKLIPSQWLFPPPTELKNYRLSCSA